MREIEILGRTLGDGHPVYIIAEGCDNHLGDVDVAMEMARRAMIAGADCIKFQHHLPDEEMLRDVPLSDNFDEPLYDFLVKHALKLDDHRVLMEYCSELGIDYLCTPFSHQAAVELRSLGLKAFKIGSGEMTDLASLEKIVRLGNPLILSTGMSTMEEIRATYRALTSWGARFCFMNCVSEYPPVYRDMNLGVIRGLLAEFPGIVIGHSDHTPDLFTSFAAVALGAKILEKHVILDKRTPGPDQSVSIDMRDLAELVEGVRKVEDALGGEKTVHEREMQVRRWAFRSIVATRDIPAGTVITGEMLTTKRPGTGIPSARIREVIGKRVKRGIADNAQVRWDDLEP